MIKDKLKEMVANRDINHEKLETIKNNKEVSVQFFDLIKNNDIKGMYNIYKPNVVYSNSIYKDLNIKEITLMILQLLQISNEHSVEYEFISSNEKESKIHWYLTYKLNANKGKKNENKEYRLEIFTKFQIENNKIIKQEDIFDLDEFFKLVYGKKAVLYKLEKSKNKQIKKYNEAFNKYVNEKEKNN